ncbi:MAG: polysaccharide biosynthesis protein [Pelagibacterales bacterium]|nr:polysaccharide biosynthesis protein [Pelagibacterales bacterium]
MKNIFRNTINSYLPKWIVLFLDLILVLLSFVISYLVRFNLSFDFQVTQFYYQLPIVCFLALISFLVTGSYRGVVRHTGFRDATNLIYALTLHSILIVSIILINQFFLINENFTIPFAIIVIHYLLNLFILIISRFLFKALYKYIILDISVSNNVIIYGAGDIGFATHSTLINDSSNLYNIIGFIDDNVKRVGKKIDGVMIYPSSILSNEFIKSKKIKEVIVSNENLSSSQFLKITDELLILNIKVKIIPSIERWIGGKLNVNQIKEIRIEDLLERNIIQIQNSIIEKELENKIIFVIGAAGSIGSEISRQISKYNYKKIIFIDQAESSLYHLQQELLITNKRDLVFIVSDICDNDRMNYFFKKYKPNYIYHAAAYKHVPLMENNPHEAINVNIGGTKILADLSLKYGSTKFLLISTDKAVNPTNVMGATKRAAEIYTLSLNDMNKTKFIVTRFGNVLGSNGSVIPLFKKQISSGGPITVTDKEITRFFMTIPEACQLVLEASVMGHGGEIFIFDMGELIKIYDLAKKMIVMSGLKFPLDIDIKIIGLRPGEKLYEELVGEDENCIPTYHDKIMMAKPIKLNNKKVISQIEEICKHNKVDGNFNIIKSLKTLIPEYISNNSIYEKLDET